MHVCTSPLNLTNAKKRVWNLTAQFAMIFYSHRKRQWKLFLVAIICIHHVSRQEAINVCTVTSSFPVKWTKKIALSAGLCSYTLYLSNLLQISWRYVGKKKLCTNIGKKERRLCNWYLLSNIFLQVYFGMIDALLAREELPDEYKSRKQVMKLDHLLYTKTLWYSYLCIQISLRE
mgnify:CR=1 FL=1